MPNSYQRDGMVSVARPRTPKASAGAAAGLPPLPPSLAAAPTLVTRLSACLQYGFVSIAITLFNRAVFSV